MSKSHEQRSVKLGRPTLYSDELAARICKAVATHDLSLRAICDKYDDFPCEDTIYAWRFEKEIFSEMFNKAKSMQAQIIAESIQEIHKRVKEEFMYADERGNAKIDSGAVALANLESTNKRWNAARLAPRVYGEKSESRVIHAEVTLDEMLKGLE